MSKFSVGDRVRLKMDYGSAKLGDIGAVDGLPMCGDDIYSVKFDAGGHSLFGHRIELVQPDSTPSPVRTKTVREIVPGKYGRVEVGPNEQQFGVAYVRFFSKDAWSIMSAASLREAARIFLDLADALDSQS